MQKLFNFNYKNQIIAVFIATFMVISDGIHYSWTSAAIFLLNKNNNTNSFETISENEHFWLESLLPLGGLAGLLINVLLMDRIGRKKCILLASLQNAISWTLIMMATNIKLLLTARFMAGSASMTTFMVLPIYIAECVEAKYRGFFGSLIVIMMTVGTLLGYIIVPYFSVMMSSAIGATINLVHIASFSLMPETPYYHLLKKKIIKAENSLRWLRNTPNVTEELSAVLKTLGDESGPKIGTLVLLFTNRKAILLMALLLTTQQFCGITVISMNTQSILQQSSNSLIEPKNGAIIFGSVMLGALLFGSILIDSSQLLQWKPEVENSFGQNFGFRFGRRFLLLVSTMCTTISLIVMSGYFFAAHYGYEVTDVVPLCALLSYAVSIRLGLSFVPIVMMGELFPTSFKAIGTTISELIFVLTAALSIRMYSWTSQKWGLHISLSTYAFFGAMATILILVFVPETKRKTLEEIQKKLKPKE